MQLRDALLKYDEIVKSEEYFSHAEHAEHEESQKIQRKLKE